MCGIFGIVGQRNLAQILVEGLERLEYRGYDSCGVAVQDGTGPLAVRKGIGEVARVRREERFDELRGDTCLGHTRWATHGRVSRNNAHPHASGAGRLAIVHNGILDNHELLRTRLEAAGHTFESETDSEVVAHLLAEEQSHGGDFEEVILRVARQLQGTYAIGIIHADHPHQLYALRKESPLLVGIGSDFHCFASDPLAFIQLTHRVAYVEDGELLVIEPHTWRLRRIVDGAPVARAPLELQLDGGRVERGTHPDYMSKEISENAVVARIALELPAEAIDAIAAAIETSPTTTLTGMGTAYYVAVMAQYVFAHWGGRFLPAITADELPYLLRFQRGDHVLAVSQSGETYDTLRALRMAREAGATTSAVLNVPTSSMAREVERVIDQKAGPEICVLSTKATTSQLLILMRVALRLGERTGFLAADELAARRAELQRLPALFERLWNRSHDPIRELARRFSVIRNWFFLGRGVYHGLALEAALKLKEVTYCHAEGMPAGFLKHGTISLIDEAMHSAVFLPGPDEPELRNQTLGAVAEIQARGGTVLGFEPEGPDDLDGHCAARIAYPPNGPLTNPLLALMQAQMFAYYSARALGRNVDKPRSLAKSVTVG